MRLSGFALILALLFAAPTWAQDRASVEEVDERILGVQFPGPREGDTRPVWIWRPNNAPQTPLPILYMADGLDGLYVAVAHLQAKVEDGTIAPFIVVATNAHERPEGRAAEYVRTYPGGGDSYSVHETWLLEQVIPRVEGAVQADPARRYIGGFSNGADLAISLVEDHPGFFAGALVHSPAGANEAWISERAAETRWAVTGGTRELAGSVERGGRLPRDVIGALERRGAPLRACIGPWDHTGRAWLDVSPGSVVWLLQLGDAEAVQTSREASFCRTGA